MPDGGPTRRPRRRLERRRMVAPRPPRPSRTRGTSIKSRLRPYAATRRRAGPLVSGQGLDVTAWLRGLGLERYARAFLDAEVTPETLPELTDADLRELGLPLGPRKAVLKAIRGLAGPAAAEAARVGVGP